MKAPIYVDDSGSTTIMELRSKARRLKSRNPTWASSSSTTSSS